MHRHGSFLWPMIRLLHLRNVRPTQQEGQVPLNGQHQGHPESVFTAADEIIRHKLPGITPTAERVRRCDVECQIPDLFEGQIVSCGKVIIDYMGPVERAEGISDVIGWIGVACIRLVVPAAVITLAGIAIG